VADCWIDPEVAFTVTVDVTGVFGVVGCVDDPPPQAIRIPAPANDAASSNIIHTLRRFPSQRKPTARASDAAGENCTGLPRNEPVVVAAAKVSCVVTALVPEGVTVVGLKVHPTPDGKPVQAKLMAL
jgi:hypothetical protein